MIRATSLALATIMAVSAAAIPPPAPVEPMLPPEPRQPERTPEQTPLPSQTAYKLVTATPCATEEIPVAAPESTPETTPRSHKGITEGDVIIGEISHYDVCEACCGKTDGVCASGLKIRNGMEDPRIVSCNWLPFGSVLDIDGVCYTVADRGGRGLDKIGRVDVFTPAGHKAARELGRRRGVEIKVVWLP